MENNTYGFRSNTSIMHIPFNPLRFFHPILFRYSCQTVLGHRVVLFRIDRFLSVWSIMPKEIFVTDCGFGNSRFLFLCRAGILVSVNSSGSGMEQPDQSFSDRKARPTTCTERKTAVVRARNSGLESCNWNMGASCGRGNTIPVQHALKRTSRSYSI